MKLEDVPKEGRRFLVADDHKITAWASNWVQEKDGECCQIRYTYEGSQAAYVLGFVRVRKSDNDQSIIEHRTHIPSNSGFYVLSKLLEEALARVNIYKENEV